MDITTSQCVNVTYTTFTQVRLLFLYSATGQPTHDLNATTTLLLSPWTFLSDTRSLPSIDPQHSFGVPAYTLKGRKNRWIWRGYMLRRRPWNGRLLWKGRTNKMNCCGGEINDLMMGESPVSCFCSAFSFPLFCLVSFVCFSLYFFCDGGGCES